jgi:Competence protein J (ComJ)
LCPDPGFVSDWARNKIRPGGTQLEQRLMMPFVVYISNSEVPSQSAFRIIKIPLERRSTRRGGRQFRKRFLINYTTLSVSRPEVLPGDWTEQHVNQGFSWRAGAVSFSVASDRAISATVRVEVCDSYTPAEHVLRLIRVPFEVGAGGVDVGSPLGTQETLPIASGQCALYFGIEPDRAERPQHPWMYHFTFVPATEPVQPAILVADASLAPPHPLVMHAEPPWTPENGK